MSESDYRIWSNADLDYEEWKDWMEEEYPTLSEDERVAMMYEENGHYLEDERLNLDIQLSQPILVVGDLGLWNGRRMGYKEIPSGNIRDCLYSDYDYTCLLYTSRFSKEECRDCLQSLWHSPCLQALARPQPSPQAKQRSPI